MEAVSRVGHLAEARKVVGPMEAALRVARMAQVAVVIKVGLVVEMEEVRAEEARAGRPAATAVARGTLGCSHRTRRRRSGTCTASRRRVRMRCLPNWLLSYCRWHR